MAALAAAACLLLPLAGCGAPSFDSNGLHFGDPHASTPDKAPHLDGEWEMHPYKTKDTFGQMITIDPNQNSTLTFSNGVITNNQEPAHSWSMRQVSYTVSKGPDDNGYYTITFAPNGQKKPSKPTIYTFEIQHVEHKGIRFKPVLSGDGVASNMQSLVRNGAKVSGNYYTYDYYAACPWFEGFEEHIPSACAIDPKSGEITEKGNSTIYPARK